MAKPPAVIEQHQLATIEPLDIKQILERTKVVAQVMEQVMKEDIHYGIIPGCKKPSLYKAGAEKIAVTFQLAIDTEIEDLSVDDVIRYRVRAIAKNLSGQFLGSAYGECSSMEEKYKWRKAYPSDFNAADEDRRREVERSGKNGPYLAKQIRTNPSDVANTILQMADKRAYVAVVRKVTAASDVFTQGVEDLKQEIVEAMEEENIQPTSLDEKPAKEKKAGKKGEQKKESPKNDNPTSDKPIGDGPMKLVQAKLNAGKISAEDLCKEFKIGSLKELPMSKINDAFAWIKEKSE